MNLESVRSALTTFTAWLFPEYCVSCQSQGSFLCERCLAQIPKGEDPPFRNVYSLFPYQDKHVQQLIKLLKYKNRTSVAAIFGQALHGYLSELLADEALFDASTKTEPWTLIPIPLSQARLKTRGYNQTELIGQSLISMEHYRIIMNKTVLYKRHNTESQVHVKDRKSRLANLKDSFGVRAPEFIKNRNIILLDDVVTTGATIMEAMHTLRCAGARQVIGLSVAH